MGDFSRPQDEDCLTLTICTPAPDGKMRPVLVWLHGGAWISGAGSLDWYDGSRLAREGDLVFVGVNYRLGALGWLHRPGIVDVEAGTSDMIAALAWVRDHIAAFGGDPACVTVMGQSAGATSIGRLLMLPDSAQPVPACHHAKRRVRSRRLHFSDGNGARGPVASSARYRCACGRCSGALCGLSRCRVCSRAQAELAQAYARFAQTMPMFMPVLPSAMKQAEMLGAIADGADGKDVLIGATADEVHAFYAVDPAMENPSADALIARFGGEAALARYRARRPGASAMDLLADLGTDETFLLPAMRLAEAVAARGGNAYAYLFDWAPPGMRFKSCHCIDLPFVFGNPDAWNDAAMLAGGDAAQMADLSAAMRRAWIAFVRNGDPAHEALPAWPRHDTVRRRTMRFGARIGVVGDPACISA